MAKIKKAMKGGSKVAGAKKGKKAPESDQVSCDRLAALSGVLWPEKRDGERGNPTGVPMASCCVVG
mgnify:CR=1 FL=1|jgi:hypothetical protein